MAPPQLVRDTVCYGGAPKLIPSTVLSFSRQPNPGGHFESKISNGNIEKYADEIFLISTQQFVVSFHRIFTEKRGFCFVF
jgi:hypothetical protein